MSAASLDPTPSPLPLRTSPPKVSKEDVNFTSDKQTPPSSSILPQSTENENAPSKSDKPSFPKPRLLFECRDLNHPASATFFRTHQPTTALSSAVHSVLSVLYSPAATNVHIPPTRSVTLILRSMGGVAYTTGKDIDNDHKEMHFSLDYINGIEGGREADEIEGVLVHEMVHCWQWNARGTAPEGLIEGIADFVRLKAGLSPPHWKKEGGGKWNAGYQHTGYFLEWVEKTWGDGSVIKINDALKDSEYKEDEFWTAIFGQKVERLWEMYVDSLKEGKEKVHKEEKPSEKARIDDDKDKVVLVEKDEGQDPARRKRE